VRADRWCECGCGRSIAFRRPQARYYEPACRAKAQRDRKRTALGDRTVSLAGQRGYFEAADAIRGYLYDWHPERETQIMLGRAQAILEEYADYLPLTCRQVYYRMIAEFHYPKGEAFERSLYDVLDKARRAKVIPFKSIRDDGIMGGGWWPTHPDQMIESWKLQARNYNRDVQERQDIRIQIWCEAAGMIPQLSKVADPYSIPVYSCGGFNSLTSIRQVVDSCLYDTDGPTLLLHLGDCDPSGYSIFQAVVEDVSEFLGQDRLYAEQEFRFERVAITLEQVQEHKLESDPITTNDSRSRIWRRNGLTHKVELEAMAPDLIASLLTEAIERHIDKRLIEVIRGEEEVERDSLMDVAALAPRMSEILGKGDQLGDLLAKNRQEVD
jgi:hypothetical protein